MINQFKNVESLLDFKKNKDQIGIVKRKVPRNSSYFFSKLYKQPFSISGNVSKKNAKEDIYKLLKNKIPDNTQSDPFFENWLVDMSKVCKLFCSIQSEKIISFWLGTKRGCKRYHIDMVPFRLLVTYAGQGTELLPDKAADRTAFINGKPNEKIVKDRSSLKFLSSWDIAIFRGGVNGILHRTPDSALDGNSSILMRLDHESFYDQLIKINGINY